MQITYRFVFPFDTRGWYELLMLRAHPGDAKNNCDLYLYEICQI